jgi:hypothetical protein
MCAGKACPTSEGYTPPDREASTFAVALGGTVWRKAGAVRPCFQGQLPLPTKVVPRACFDAGFDFACGSASSPADAALMTCKFGTSPFRTLFRPSCILLQML